MVNNRVRHIPNLHGLTKKKVRTYLIFFYLCFAVQSRGQVSDFDFVIHKIKIDYPAFAVKTIGIDFDKFVQKILKQNRQDTFTALSAIVHFFNDQHLQIYASRKSILKDTLQCRKNLNSIMKYLTSVSVKKKYEGYWVNDYSNIIIGLRLENYNPITYQAFVIESRDSFYLPGTILCHFQSNGGNNFNTDYYSPLVKARYFVKADFRCDTVFTTGADGKWYKLKKYSKPILKTLPEYDLKASGKLLDKSNYLLTIPMNSAENADIVDSLIDADSVIISKTPNLIIDIRNNLGGTSRVYNSLLPIICTNFIKKTQVYYYATEDDIQNSLRKIESYKKRKDFDSVYLRSWLKKIHNKQDSIGKFMLLKADTFQCIFRTNYPKNVALIINYACQSAAELMILDFMQSNKVTLFGEHSMGAVDYLDYYQLQTPSGKYALYMPTTKRVIQPGREIDGKGIYPQVPISDNEKDWIQFVKRHYEKK